MQNIIHIPHLPAHSIPLNLMQSCTLMHMQQCTWQCYIVGQTSAGVSNLRCGNHPLCCTHSHFFALFLHLSLTRILKAVVISRPHPPSLNEKAITIGLSPIPVAWQRCPKTCFHTCLQLCVCFSLRFASLPLYLFSLSLWLQTLSLSPSSLQPLSFAPPISEL